MRAEVWAFVIGNSLVIRIQELVISQQPCAVQRGEQILFDLGENASGNRGACHEDEFHRLGQFMLVLAETFAEQSPGAAAFHRAADFPARDDAEPGRRAVGQKVPVGDKTTQCKTLALLPYPREITVLAKTRFASQPQATGVWRLGSGVWSRGAHEHTD